VRCALFFVCLSTAGCYCSHERGPGETDAADAPILPDAPSPDGPSPDAPSLDAPGPDVDRCASEVSIAVRVEPVTADPTFCEGTRFEGVMVLGVEPAPADEGIRIHADFCPARGADCRCDVVVSNVGADLADLVLMPREGNTFEIAPTVLAVTTTPTCECLGCPCSFALVFAASSGLLTVPGPAGTGELALSTGAETCAAPSACESAAWRLHGSSLGIETDVPAGEDRDLGVVHLRSLRDVDLFAPCAACATCGSPEGSWAAWVRH
jgi:hypothetical protein